MIHLARLDALHRCRRGVAAIEFTLIAPVLLLLIFGIIAFGSYLTVVNAVDQLAAEAARAAVAGLSDDERTQLAQKNIATHATSYPFVDPTRLHIVASSTDPSTNAFSIVLKYDASNLALFGLSFLPMPPAIIQRSASIQRGGF